MSFLSDYKNVGESGDGESVDARAFKEDFIRFEILVVQLASASMNITF